MNIVRFFHISGRVLIGICFLLAVLLLQTGCIRYQFITVDSNLQKTEKNEFVEETGAVKMTYSFSGKDFPITINIFNKLPHPLYLDLQHSMVIMNNDSIPGAFATDNNVDSIGPQSSAVVESVHLSDKFIPLTKQDKISEVFVQTTSGQTNVSMHCFDEEISPVYFRSVLAVSAHADHSTPAYYDHPFWVSGVYEAYDSSPYNPPANQFSLEKNSAFATVMGYTLGIILLAAPCGR